MIHTIPSIETMVTDYGNYIYHFALRLTCHPADAEDLAVLEAEGQLLIKVPPSPLDEIQTSEEIRLLRDGCFLAMARKLTLNQRIVFSLTDMFGLSMEETAQILDLSPSAVKGLLYRARMSLDSFFKGHCNFLDIHNPCSCQAWIDFSNRRSQYQNETRKLIQTLDYRDRDYTFDPDTRAKVCYYYRQMPEKTPSEEWYHNVMKALHT